MRKLAFIGLGNMGGGMAANQAKAGHNVAAFDLSAAALEKAAAAGCPVNRVMTTALTSRPQLLRSSISFKVSASYEIPKSARILLRSMSPA